MSPALSGGVEHRLRIGVDRTAYGYRDDDYFFLKIRQAFPGVGS